MALFKTQKWLIRIKIFNLTLNTYVGCDCMVSFVENKLFYELCNTYTLAGTAHLLSHLHKRQIAILTCVSLHKPVTGTKAYRQRRVWGVKHAALWEAASNVADWWHWMISLVRRWFTWGHGVTNDLFTQTTWLEYYELDYYVDPAIVDPICQISASLLSLEQMTFCPAW